MLRVGAGLFLALFDDGRRLDPERRCPQEDGRLEQRSFQGPRLS